MPISNTSIRNWRRRAAEMRASAETTKDAKMIATMRRLADATTSWQTARNKPNATLGGAVVEVRNGSPTTQPLEPILTASLSRTRRRKTAAFAPSLRIQSTCSRRPNGFGQPAARHLHFEMSRTNSAPVCVGGTGTIFCRMRERRAARGLFYVSNTLSPLGWAKLAVSFH